MSLPANVIQIQGQGSISADMENTKVQWCQTVAQLRSFIGLPTMAVFVEGINAPDDGGQGMFFWQATVTQPDDGKNYIIPPGANSGGWIRFGVIAANFASLPAPSILNQGARTFIKDGAASPVFGAAAVGGGTLYTPVYSDAIIWRNG